MESLWSHLVGHFTWWSIVVFVSWCFLWLEKARVLKFFGINRRCRDVKIYVSRVDVKPSGVRTLEPNVEGFSGTVISHIEYKGAIFLQKKLRSLYLIRLPEGFRHWLGELNPTLIAVEAEIEPCPKELGIPNCNLVLIGSNNYNSLTKQCIAKFTSLPLSFEVNDEAQELYIMDRTYKYAYEGHKRRQYGMIQRVKDEDGHVIVICAGYSQGATIGCVRYLANHWRQIYKRHGERFGLVLEWPELMDNPDREPIDDPILVLRERAK